MSQVPERYPIRHHSVRFEGGASGSLTAIKFCGFRCFSLVDMKQVDPMSVLVVPWYERGDFEQLRLVSQGSALPLSYNAWLDSAFSHMRQLLSQGRALKIVTIHLDDYFTWLENGGQTDSAETRRRYIKELSAAGSQLPGATLDTDVPWPGFPETPREASAGAAFSFQNGMPG